MSATISADELIRLNPGVWLETHGYVRDVRGKKTRPVLNVLQRRMNALYMARMMAGKSMRGIVVKPRKRGASTMVSAHHYSQLQNWPHEGFIIGDRSETTGIVFRMLKFYAETDEFIGKWGSPIKSATTEELVWEHGSMVTQGTAQGRASARGRTPQFVHETEKAHWEKPEETSDAVLNAVPDEGFTVIWEESTPFGSANLFAKTFGEARWPRAEECPDEFLYWKQWASLVPDQDSSGGSDLDYCRVFAAWFEFDTPGARSYLRLNEDGRKQIQDTIDAEGWYRGERELIRRYGNEGPRGMRLGQIVTECDVWEQLAWRRATIKNKCRKSLDVFNSEHPSDPKTCVEGSQRIGTDHGLIPIRDVRAGMMTARGRVLAHVCMGTKPTVTLRTQRGFELRVTADHLIALPDGSFQEAGQTLGARIKLQRPEFSIHRHVARWKAFGGVDASLEIDERWGRFLGYFMGDGSLHNCTLSIACDSQDQDTIADCTRLIDELFGTPQIRKTGKTGGGTEVRFSRKEFHELFEHLGIIEFNGKGYSPHIRKVCVPECIFSSPKSVVREFLRGLFESDGHIIENGGAAKLFTKHASLARDVQLLLLGMDIQSTILYQRKRVKDREFDGYEVIIYRRDVEQFLDEIGFISARKRARRPLGKLDRRAGTYDYTDEVVEIIPSGDAEVFDIEIEGDPVFDAGGILVHNCFVSSGRSVFDSEALDRVWIETERARPEYVQIEIKESGDGRQRRAQVNPSDSEMATIYIFERPRFGCRYLMPVDLSEGKDQTKTGNPDANSAMILRDAYVDQNGLLEKMAVAARVRPPNHMPLPEFARITAGLGLFYGNCMQIPEMNNSGLAYITALRLLFPWVPIWQRSERDPITGHVVKEMYGWRTTDISGYGGVRTQIIAHLQDILMENSIKIPCAHIHRELANFVNKDGRMEAGAGKDDDVLTLAIGTYNISSGTIYSEPQVVRSLPRDLVELAGRSEHAGGGSMRY